MSKEYKFEFCGTKDDLVFKIKTLFNGSCGNYYYKDYIIDIVENEIRFGVERAGHSGGYWYIPTITECGGKIELYGNIRYIGPEDKRSKIHKAIENVLYFILFLPIWLIAGLYVFAESIFRKIFKRPKPRNTKEKLFDLMEKHLGCSRK